MNNHKIAYVLKRFPRFSETFILNELLSHESAGAEVHIYSLLKPPKEKVHAKVEKLKARVTYLTSKYPGTPTTDMDNVDGIYLGKSEVDVARLKSKALQVADDIRRLNITHLHAHFGSDATTVALLASQEVGGTFSYTAHARDIYHTYVDPDTDARVRSKKLGDAEFVVTVSDYNVETLRALNATARLVRIYNGIDLDTFAPVTPARQTRGRIIAVGRLVPKKGFDILLQACRLLLDRGVDFELSIVGTGPLEDDIRMTIGQLGLASQVRLKGSLAQEDLVELMSTAEIAALPCIVTDTGDRDGLPTVLLEAMARALPVVTTTVSGGPEIVDHGKTGLLCKPGDPVSLADSLEALVKDPIRAREMGLHGRERAERLFDLQVNAEQLRRLLKEASSTKSAESVA